MNHLMITNRIKYYRELLNITQKQLGRELLSLPTIKAIESKRNKLNIKTASIIANNLNYYAEEKGIKLNITASDLMKPQKMCAREFCEKELSQLETFEYNLEGYIDLLNVAEKYKLNDLTPMITKRIGENYYKTEKYNEAMEYYEKSILLYSASNQNKETIDLINKVGNCYYNLEQYKMAFKYYKNSISKYYETNEEDEYLLSKILYNLALSSSKLNKSEESLKYLDNLLNFKTLKEDVLFAARILRGIIYSNIKKYEEALEIYEELLREYPDNYIINFNLSTLYNSLNNKEKSIEYLNKTLELQMKHIDERLTLPIIKLGIKYEKSNNFKAAIKCYENAIKNAVKFNQAEYLIRCYRYIFDISKEKEFDYLHDELAMSIDKNIDMLKMDSNVKSKLLLLLIDIIMENPNEIIVSIINKIRKDDKYEKD